MGGKQEMCSLSGKRGSQISIILSILILIIFLAHNSLQDTKRPQLGLNELGYESVPRVQLMKN